MSQNSTVIINEITKGTGAAIQKGQTATVHYTGKLNDKDGDKFDSSRDREDAFEFKKEMVIAGWGIGIFGDGAEIAPMNIGGVREMTIPPHLAYGKGGAGGIIGPDATLYFEVELLDAK